MANKKSNKKKDDFKLVLEVNQKFIDGDKFKFKLGNAVVMTTPLNLDQDYWQFRVRVHEDQEVVGFPKFTTIGIGFAKEDDWNTNLPYSCNTKTIFEHIKHNKRYDSIPDERCIKAIKMIQEAAEEFKKVEEEAEEMIILQNEPKLKEDKGGMISLKEFKERCNISRAGRMETFVNGFGTEYKKRKYCLLFGYDHNQRAYKYRAIIYAEKLPLAVRRFYYAIRQYNLNGSNIISDRFNEFLVAEENKYFKIPIFF